MCVYCIDKLTIKSSSTDANKKEADPYATLMKPFGGRLGILLNVFKQSLWQIKCKKNCIFIFQHLSDSLSSHPGTSCVSRVSLRQVVAAFRADLKPPCTWPWWPVGRGWRRLSPWSSLRCFSASSASTCTSSLRISYTPASWKSWVGRSLKSLLRTSRCCWLNDLEIVCRPHPVL